MAKQFIDDGEKGFIVRKKINENFSELYYNDSLFLSGSNLSLNYLTKYGNANTLLNSIVYDNGTHVGIGTGSPTDRLHVAGGNIVGYSGATSSYTGVVVRNGTSAAYTIDGRIVVDTTNTPNKVIIGSETNHPLQIVTNNTQRVWIDSSGILASGNLNVSGDVTISGNLSALGTTTQIDTKMYVTSAVSVINTGTGPALTIKQTGSNDIATFFDDNNVAMIIKDGGNIGIGTSSPTRRLNVFGTPTLNGDNRAIIGLMDNTSMNSGVGGGIDFGGIYNIAGNYAEWSGIKGIKENNVNGDYAGALAFMSRAMGNSTSERMRISSTGNVGIGTTSPQTKLHISGASTELLRITDGTMALYAGCDNNNPWFGTSTNNDLRLTTNATEKLRITAAGNVGIGTTSPSTKLEISNSSTGGSSTWQGGTDFLKLFANNGDFSEQAIAFQETGTNVGAKIGVKNVGNGAYDIIFANRNTSSLTSTLTEKLRITNTGNVGIGTDSPSGVLDVNGNAYFNKGRIGGGNHVTIRGYQTNNGYGVLAFTTSGPSGTSDVNIATIAGLITSHTVGSESGGLQFTTVNAGVASEKMRLDASGRLGIGTTSPQRALHVFSDGIFPIKLESSNTNTTGLEIYNSTSARTWENAVAGTSNLAGIPAGSYYIYDQSGGAGARMVIGTTGNVGIGVSNPSASLQFANVHGKKISMWDAFNDDNQFYGFGIDSGTLIYNVESSVAKHVFYSGINSTSKRELFRINGDGNVGIGTSSPQGRLDVNGGFTIIRPTNDDPAGGHSILIPRAGTDPYTNPSRLEIRLYGTESIIYNHWAGTGVARNLTVGSGGAYHHYNGTTGNIGIGTTSPNEKLTIVGNLSASGTGVFKTVNANTTSNDVLVLGADNTIEKRTLTLWNAGSSGLLGNGLTTNYLTKYGTSNDLLNSQIFDNGTNVGVGTASPDYILDIGNGTGNKTVRIRGGSTGTSDGAGLLIANNTNNLAAFGNYSNLFGGAYDATATIWSANSLIFVTNGGTSESMRISSAGNVGIGTSSPSVKLEIKAGAENQSSTREAIRIWGPNEPMGVNSGQSLSWKFQNAGSTAIRSYRGGSWDTYLDFFTTPSSAGGDIPQSRMTIDHIGNVGIGTTTPSTKLHISSTDTFGFTIENTTVAPTNAADADNFTLFKNYYGNTQISNWQNVGMRIGSRTTANGGTGQIVFTTGNDTERMRLNASGNLGIGTSSPQSLLHVNTLLTGDQQLAQFTNPNVSTNENGYIVVGGNNSFNNGAFLGFCKTGTSTGYVNLAVRGKAGLVVKEDGNVGIGITSPTQKLHVVGDSDANGTALFAAPAANASIKIDAATSGHYAYQTFSQAGLGRFELGIDNLKNFYINRNVQQGSTGASIYINKLFGSVGIGTTSPRQLLDVYGNIAFGAGTGTASGSGTIKGNQTSPVSIRQEFGTDDTGWQYRIAKNNGGVITDLVTVVDNGNVGIGTSSPATNARLDLSGGGLNIGGTGNLDAAIHIKSSFGGMDRLTQMSPTGASKPALNLIASTDVNSNNNWWVWGVDSNVWKIQPSTTFSGSAGLFINSSGNVGIGTITPSAMLHVAGSVYVQSTSNFAANALFQSTSDFVGNVTFNSNRGSSNNHITIRNTTTANGSITFSTYIPTSQTEVNTSGIRGIATDNTSGYGDLTLVARGSSDNSPLEKVKVCGDSNVGIGTRVVGITTITNATGLTVGAYGLNTACFINLKSSSTNGSMWYENAQGVTFGTDNSKPLIFETSGAERMRIVSGGNVGVGTSIPARVLHTNGTIRFEGLSVHANNSDAKTAGLMAGDVYRTSTGELRIVF